MDSDTVNILILNLKIALWSKKLKELKKEKDFYYFNLVQKFNTALFVREVLYFHKDMRDMWSTSFIEGGKTDYFNSKYYTVQFSRGGQGFPLSAGMLVAKLGLESTDELLDRLEEVKHDKRFRRLSD